MSSNSSALEALRSHWGRQSPLALCRRAPRFLLRRWRKRSLGRAYRRGQVHAGAARVAEETDPALIATGGMLRAEVLAANHGRHGKARYRVLMFRPASLTAEIWFGDLAQCMRHAGIECRELAPDTPAAAINQALESFAPNVFIATESTRTLQAVDLPFLRNYKYRQGCLRLFVPVWHANASAVGLPGQPSTPEQDAWRRRLRWEGLTADAHFSIFEPEFHSRFSHDPNGPPVEYVAIPMACNPFNDHPRPALKCQDYFMAASMTDDRIEVSHRYLRQVLSRYQGLWAGEHWGFGVPNVPPPQMPVQYARSRIALSPLVRFVRRHGAELTHRVYAAAGCGAFQITSTTPITDRYFAPDELVQARSGRDFVRLFDHYIDRPLERNAIALAAMRRAYGEHTCFHRLDTLVSHWNRWRARGLF